MSEQLPTVTLTDEERKRRAKEARAAKVQKKAERLAERKSRELLLSSVVGHPVSWEEVMDGSKLFGDYPLVQSQLCSQSWNELVSVGSLNASMDNSYVSLRARVHSVRGKGRSVFLLLRQGMDRVQATFFQTDETPEGMAKYISKLSKETVVDVTAKIVKVQVPIASATLKDIELSVVKLFVVSRAGSLPFLVEDAMVRSAHENEALENGTYTYIPNIGQDLRLNNRVIDLRVPAHLAVFRIQSAVGRFFREYLYTNDFVEIHTPKLVSAAFESSINAFGLNYFGDKAYLAQSPQLYKQMAVNGDLMRVFEIGPAFRAEWGHTHRHLTEFVSLDLEMAIQNHYSEVLDIVDQMFIYIFENIEQRFAKELTTIQTQYPFEPLQYNKKKNLRLTFLEAVALLRQDGMEIGDCDDLDTWAERRLGALVKQQHGTDFYFVEKYPMSVRPFYTMPCPEDEKYSNSFDIFLRGEEISTGAQRIHDPELLVKKATEKGVDVAAVLKELFGATWP